MDQETEYAKEAARIIKEAEKAEKRAMREAERAAKKAAKEAQKPKKETRSEAELVRHYAEVIIKKQTTRGMLRKEDLTPDSTKPNKDLWRDTEFFFSVVFQSYTQKYEFLDFLQEKFKIQSNDDGVMSIQIVNGLKLAEAMGLQLKPEVANDYQPVNLELSEFILP